MIGGGLTGRHNARKMYSSNAKRSKYTAVLTTPEQLRAEELLKAKEATADDEAIEVDEPAPTKISVDELTNLAGKMRIGKK